MNKTKLPHLHPIYQKPTDLRLIVADQDWSDQFTTLKHYTLHHRDLTLHVRIIGESHIITIQRGQHTLLQEILACSDFAPANSLCAYHFGTLAAYAYNRDNYSVAVSFHPQPDSAWIPAGVETLELQFPAMWGHTPLTRIGWQCTEDTIQWWTLHIYPEQACSTCVHTVSIWRGD